MPAFIPPVIVTTHLSPSAAVPSSVIVASDRLIAAPLESFAEVVRVTVPAVATLCCRPSGSVVSGRPFSVKPVALLLMMRKALLPSPSASGVTLTV